MTGDSLAHAGGAAVAQFDLALVEDGMVFVAWREVLAQELRENLSDICLHTLIKRWVEPEPLRLRWRGRAGEVLYIYIYS